MIKFPCVHHKILNYYISKFVLIIGGSKFIAKRFGEKLLDTGLRNYFPFPVFPLFITTNIQFFYYQKNVSQICKLLVYNNYHLFICKIQTIH